MEDNVVLNMTLNQTFSYTFHVTDVDNDTLNINVTGAPPGSIITYGTNTVTITWLVDSYDKVRTTLFCNVNPCLLQSCRMQVSFGVCNESV